jgi:O-antigen biosynthesis protein
MTPDSQDLFERRYVRRVSPEGEDSLSRIARRIAPGSVVLDVGTGPGALGQYLTSERGCTVDGIESDPSQLQMARPHYRRILALDLESAPLHDALAPGGYDAIVFADVLEHLREPGRALDQLVRLLRPGGRILISIPNVGYAGVIAGLLAGEFAYRPTGLLDQTHLRFFTRRSLLRFLREHGLGVLSLEAVTYLIHHSEFRDHYLDQLQPSVREAVFAQPDSLTYQFVAEAAPGLEGSVELAEPVAPRVTFGLQLYFRSDGGSFEEANSVTSVGDVGASDQSIRFSFPRFNTPPVQLRLDVADRPGFLRLHRIQLLARDGAVLWRWSGDQLTLAHATSRGLVEFCSQERRWWISTSSDPYVELPIPPELLRSSNEGALIVDLDWPMAPDYFAAQRILGEQAQVWEKKAQTLDARALAAESRFEEHRQVLAGLAERIETLEKRREEHAKALAGLEQRMEANAHAAALVVEHAHLFEKLRRVRSVARRLRRALFPRRFSLSAEPAGDVVGGESEWESIGSDPRFNLRTASGRLPAGWAEVDLEIESAGGEPFSPRLYFDEGGGIDEERSLRLPEPVGGRSRGLIKLPSHVRAMRLDPLDMPGRFRMGPLRVRELSRALAAIKMGAPWIRRSLKEPSRLPGIVRTAVDVYRKEGWAAMRRRFREAALAPAPVHDYHTWVQDFDTLTNADRERIKRLSAEIPQDLSFAVVLMVSPQDAAGEIDASVRSIESQLFGQWTGIVVGPPEVAASKRLATFFRERKRWNWPPSAAWISQAGQPLVVFLRPGDILAEHALYLLAQAFAHDPGTEIVYPDEDAVIGGKRDTPQFKPDWSPYRIWCQDYVRHRFACRIEVLRRAGLSESFGAESLFALLLRALPTSARVHHAPFVLFHVQRSMPREMTMARQALEQHLRDFAPGATIQAGKLPETLRIRLPLPLSPPLVSIIIPTRNRGDLLRRCIESLRASTAYQAYEIMVVDNNSDETDTVQYLADLERQGHVRVVVHPGEFNFAAINNAAARQARGDVLVFLNNDIEIPTAGDGWLTEMVSWALRHDVGAVGCRLRYEDGRVQHAGVVIGMRGVAAHLQPGLGGDEPGYGGAAWTLREVGAATAACLALRREVFEQVNGFDEDLRVAFNDVDLCLRIRQTGRAILFTPFADLFHLESATRGEDREHHKLERLRREVEHMRARYGSSLLNDPYYSPNLSLKSNLPDLAFPPRIQRPWRFASEKRPKLALLTYRLRKGYGVDVVVAEQVEYFCARGYDIALLVLDKDDHYDSRLKPYLEAKHLQIVKVHSAEEAASHLVANGIEMAIAHTPPFYETLALLPRSSFRVLFDHGEPPASLFEDAHERRQIAARKKDISRAADLTVSISRFIQGDSGLFDPQLCFNGSDHLLRRRSNLRKLAGRFRADLGLGDDFVVLNVTRYLGGERLYKGVGHYADVRDALMRSHPDLQGRVRFVLAGRSEPADRAWAESRGLVALSNLDDDQLIAAYLDSNIYLSTSQWEGYNLGLAQALALGVPTLASARGAHPEFPIRTSDDPEMLATWIHSEIAKQGSPGSGLTAKSSLQRLQSATVVPWRTATHRLETLLRQGIERRGNRTLCLPVPLETGSAGSSPAISFLILNKDRPDLLMPCISSIEQHCNVPYEILIGDTGSTDPGMLRFYQTTPHQVHYLGFYNFSSSNNILAARASGRHLLFLNNDTKLIRTDFREALEYLERHPDVACLGGYLTYADSRIQHAGVRICPEAPYRGIPEHFDRFKPIEGYPGLKGPREVVAVTGAMLLIETEQYANAGGFDEIYEEEAQDIDLCLRLRQKGLRSVVHPALVSYHYENSTRTVKESPGDRTEFLRRYQRLFEDGIYQWQAKAGLS